MTNEVKWTNRALDEYDKLLDYLFEKWGEQITYRVIVEINQTISMIQNTPEHFPIFLKSKQVRRRVASPQTSVFLGLKKII